LAGNFEFFLAFGENPPVFRKPSQYQPPKAEQQQQHPQAYQQVPVWFICFDIISFF